MPHLIGDKISFLIAFYRAKLYIVKFIHDFCLLNIIFWKARDYHLKDHNQLFSKSIFIQNNIICKTSYM